MIKLSVGANDIDDMARWIADSKAGRDELNHVTRMFPRRGDEILAGGSLYWVIKGFVLCRFPIVGLVPVKGRDGIERCRIDFKPQLVPVRPVPRRAFQGWRYLSPDDAPPDLTRASIKANFPPKMRKELLELGLL